MKNLLINHFSTGKITKTYSVRFITIVLIHSTCENNNGTILEQNFNFDFLIN